jgi:hypothetical protein
VEIGRERSRGGAHCAWRRTVVVWGPGSESSTRDPFNLSGVDDRMQTKLFLRESWATRIRKALFCYSVAEDEWL